MPLRQTTDFLSDFDKIMSHGSQSSSDESSPTQEEESKAEYNLATLRHLNPITHRIIDDPDWQHSGSSSFEQRFSVTRYYLPPPVGQGPRSMAPSETSSMAVTAPATPSTRPPSLAGTTVTLASGSEARTSCAASVLRPHQNVLETGHGGVLEVPATSASTSWQCSFSFLGCVATFDDMEAWDVHCQAHFRGSLPSTISCPFACPQSFTGSSISDVWRERRVHIRRSHEPGDQLDTRPDRTLINHLWRTRVITDAAEQELRRFGQLIQGGVYLESTNSARDVRRRELHSV